MIQIDRLFNNEVVMHTASICIKSEEVIFVRM